jgi:hypothetical protein
MLNRELHPPSQRSPRFQVQEVVAHLDKPEGSNLFQRAQCASSEIKKVLHLTDVNMKLEDHAAKLTTQLHLLQQEADCSHAQIHQLTESLAAQHAQHDKLMAEQAQHHSAQDKVVRAELHQLHQQYCAKNAQVCFATLPHCFEISHGDLLAGLLDKLGHEDVLTAGMQCHACITVTQGHVTPIMALTIAACPQVDNFALAKLPLQSKH